MGNIEKPLTWALIVVSLGILLMGNYKSSEENNTKPFNNEQTDICKLLNLTPEECDLFLNEKEENLNVDSIVDAVLEDIGMESNIDTTIKIDQAEENKEQ